MSVTARRRRRLAEMCGWRCHWCEQPTRLESGWMNTATTEHMVPVSQGGTNEPWNITSACRRCNGTRGSMDMHEFELMARRFTPDARSVAEYELACRRKRRSDYKRARRAAETGAGGHLEPGSRAHRLFLNRMARQGTPVLQVRRWSWAWFHRKIDAFFSVDIVQASVMLPML